MLAACRPAGDSPAAPVPPPPLREAYGALFDWEGYFDGWDAGSTDVEGLGVGACCLRGITTSPRALLVSPPLDLDPRDARVVEVRLRSSAAGAVRLCAADGGGRDHCEVFPLQGTHWQLLTLDLSAARRPGRLRRISVAPSTQAGALFEIDYVRVLG